MFKMIKINLLYMDIQLILIYHIPTLQILLIFFILIFFYLIISLHIFIMLDYI